MSDGRATISKLFIPVLICLSFLMPSQLNAKEKFIIAGGELATLFDEHPERDEFGMLRQGAYHDLISHILRETGLDGTYQVLVYSMPRAKSGFSNKKFACFSPGFEMFSNPEERFKNMGILSSQPFNKAIIRVLSRQGEPLISGAKDIGKQNTISYVAEGPINKEMRLLLERASDVYPVDSELENIKLLMANRVTNAIVFYPDVLSAYANLNMNKHFPYDRTFAPLRVDENIICHENHKVAFDLIEQSLTRMKLSGRLKELLGKAYLGDKY